jgi:transposase
LVFLDESGFFLLATLRRTLAPRGQTPLHRQQFRRDKLSAISAITVSPHRRRLGLFFALLPDNENVHGEDTVHALRALHRHYPGPLTVLWDRSQTHNRSRAVQRYLASHPGIVTAEFPGYAPELNPDEQVWTHLKGHTLANYAPPCLAMLRTRLEQEASTLRKRVDLLAAFIKHTKLPLRL